MDLSFFPVRGYARQCDVSPLYRAQYAYCPSDGRASDSRNDPIAVWDNERRLEISDRTGKRGKLKGYCDRVNERIQGMAGDYSEKYVVAWCIWKRHVIPRHVVCCDRNTGPIFDKHEYSKGQSISWISHPIRPKSCRLICNAAKRRRIRVFLIQRKRNVLAKSIPSRV